MEVHFAVWQGRVSGNRALIDGTEMLRFFNDRFIHEITHEKRSVRPEECCGGILADEMGMGKSLTLLALILSSLDEARISAIQNRAACVRMKREPYSRATLIIAPKSSTLILSPLNAFL